MELVTGADDREPMVAPQPQGRVFSIRRRPLLADCAPSGRARLDALARWMQDVAFADVEDAGLERAAIWVLRRHRIRVTRFPRFGEHCAVHTFCSGIGRMWAQRRTTVMLEGAADEPGERLVEALALWVHLDPVRRLPSPLTEAELEVYGASAGERRTRARLQHPHPANVEQEWPWRFHRTDADIADHVNNAAYWKPLEDELLAAPQELAQVDAELEFRTAAQPGPMRILAGGRHRWIAAAGRDEVYASAIILHRQPEAPRRG